MKSSTDANRFVIIMAGGRGERFWPLSREKMPKQLLALLGKKSFLQEAVERVLPLVPARSTMGVMAVLPADHVIPDPKKFQQILGDSFDLASRGQATVTIGIKPSEPATGYGYIRV